MMPTFKTAMMSTAKCPARPLWMWDRRFNMAVTLTPSPQGVGNRSRALRTRCSCGRSRPVRRRTTRLTAWDRRTTTGARLSRSPERLEPWAAIAGPRSHRTRGPRAGRSSLGAQQSRCAPWSRSRSEYARGHRRAQRVLDAVEEDPGREGSQAHIPATARASYNRMPGGDEDAV